MTGLPSPSVLLGVPGFVEWYPGQQDAFEKSIDWFHSPARFLGLSLPTGSGKSCISVLIAKMSGARACILTATKGLQDQLMRDFGSIASVVKGQNNFRCTLVPTLNADEGPCHDGMLCAYSRSGGCAYREQLKKALDAQIVITNYAYYLAQTRYSSGLGEFGLVVCVPGDTNVLLADGTQMPIQDIVENERRLSVKSVNLETGELVDSCITDWHMVECKVSLLHISTPLGSFRVTADHEVWTDRGYVKAGNLKLGDTVYGYITESRAIGSGKSARRCKFAPRKVGYCKPEDENKSLLETEESSGCQVSRTPRVGEYEPEEGQERRLGGVQLLFHNEVSARTSTVLPALLSREKENRIPRVVRFGGRAGTSLVVHGQWQFRTEQECADINALVWREREQTVVRLAEGCVGGGQPSCGRQQGQRVLSGIECGGSGSSVPSYPTICGVGNVLQSDVCYADHDLHTMRDSVSQYSQCALLLSRVSNERAEIAGEGLVSTKIRGIMEAEIPRFVYDITVGSTHNFFADGHLVKNCDEGHSAFGALENHLTVYLDRMSIESIGLQFPSLPTSDIFTAKTRRTTKKTPVVNEKAPETENTTDTITAPDLWAQWQSWASCGVPVAQERATELEAEVRELRESNIPVPGALSRSYRTAKSTLAKLQSLSSSSGTGDWVIQHTHHGMVFTPRWVAGSGSALFQSVPKIMLMSAILSHKTADSIGVPTGDDRAWLEVGSYFPAANTPIWHVPTARINYRSDDYATTIWQSRIDQIIQRRLDRKGIIFTVSYDRARLLLSRSRFKDIMLTHSTGDVTLVVSRFKAMKPPAVLVSPTVTTGWDFPGLDYIIVGKIPYPDTKDLVLQARHEDDKEWSSYLAMETLVQECGRGTRCLSLDAQILTADGWKGYGDIKIGDLVYSLLLHNFVSGSANLNGLGLTPVRDIVLSELDKQMVRISGSAYDLLVTCDHDVIVQHRSKRVKSGLCKVRADCLPARFCLPVSGHVQRDRRNTEDRIVRRCDWLRLAGLLISDGWFSSKRNTITIVQSTSKPHVCAEIDAVLARLKLTHRKYVSDTIGTEMSVGGGRTYQRNGNRIAWRVTGFDSMRIRRFFLSGEQVRCPEKQQYSKKIISVGKTIPMWVLQKCRKRELRSLLEGLMLGDGTWHGDRVGTYYTSDCELADRLQYLLVLSGYRSHIRLRRQNSYEIQFSDNKFVDVTADNVAVEDYSGKTWCVSTDLGSIVVRRNGKTAITGNSATDKCEVLIVDDAAKWFMYQYRNFAPKWFMERWRGSLTCVPEPLV